MKNVSKGCRRRKKKKMKIKHEDLVLDIWKRLGRYPELSKLANEGRKQWLLQKKEEKNDDKK